METGKDKVRPYGDTMDDGAMQLSFTLPLELDEVSSEVARTLGEQMGLTDVGVAYSRDLGRGFSFFI